MNLDLDINLIAGLSIIGNIILIITYIILGPRAPRTSKEVEKTIVNMAEAIQYDVIIVNLNPSEPDGADYIIFSKPEMKEKLHSIFKEHTK